MAMSAPPPLFQAEAVFVVLFFLNLLQYLDRGIVPGASDEFAAFIEESTHTESPSILIGLLQSSFIVGFAIASVAFGHLIHFYSPFVLCTVGMTIWCAAALSSGIAINCNSYTALVLARCLSGVGESSLACSLPPWIEAQAKAGRKASWLGLYYSALPLGTAIGYVYSSLVSRKYGPQYAYYFEVILMVPFLIYLAGASRVYPDIATAHHQQQRAESDDETDGSGKGRRPLLVIEPSPPTLLEELKIIFNSHIFVSLCLGYAAQTGALIGISTFGSPLLQGLGFYETESGASTALGCILGLAGVGGSLTGGFVLDARARGMQGVLAPNPTTQNLSDSKVDASAPADDNHDVLKASVGLKQSTALVWFSSAMASLCLWCSFIIYDKILFLLVVGIGCGLIFLTVPGINISIMHSVPPANKNFAIGVCNLMIHALGDVPSPLIAGYLKDKFAPHCAGVDAATPECRADNRGLREAFLIVSSWLCFAIMFFGFAYLMAGVLLANKARANELFEDSRLYISVPTSLSEPLMPEVDAQDEGKDDGTYVL